MSPIRLVRERARKLRDRRSPFADDADRFIESMYLDIEEGKPEDLAAQDCMNNIDELLNSYNQ